MDEFTAELRARLTEAREELRRARENGDEHGVQIASGRLDNLNRLAADHGISPDAADEAR
ncbi:hypothetical protein GCM10010116_03110 [Microbispora rosea subsp. aerata]|nr:hypothetical protein [Microbispora rosea]GGO01676.1 hypothetical protein GCM10010116_03110 [Microbispora rosea subsp. aerata]GIH58317.1 hypothetical protein Mro02_52310 [Microbispora rosea subsp. aerata]GLJ87171.1 hypothetical protein GCM10017588_59150 [Microbispora rosea subsp. aerata]